MELKKEKEKETLENEITEVDKNCTTRRRKAKTETF